MLDNHAPPAMGDRSQLSSEELHILDLKVLPTARRWLSIPGLDRHAMQTLAYWGETFEVPMYLRSVEERERAGL
jgi:hypothetical protein